MIEGVSVFASERDSQLEREIEEYPYLKVNDSLTCIVLDNLFWRTFSAS